jgi:hypothetical protein
MLKKILIGLAIFLLLGIGGIYLVLPPINVPIAIFQGGVQADESLLTQRISLPDGFRFNVFATDLPGARMMKITAQGDLLVTTPSTGVVHLLFKDINHDGAADGRKLILSGLEKPHGVELFQGWL